MIKYPLVPMGMLVGAGIWLGDRWELPPFWGWIVAGLAGTLGLVDRRHRQSWLLLFGFLVGWATLSTHTAVHSPQDLRQQIGEAQEEAVVRGVLLASPTVTHYEREDATNDYSAVILQASQIRCGRRAWQQAEGLVLANFQGLLPPGCFKGRRVEVAGIIGPPRGSLLPGAFDYREHLRHKKIYYQLRGNAASEWRFLESSTPPPPLADRFIAWAQQGLGKGLPVEDEELRLVWSMLLGWKPGLTNEIAAPFMQTGTLHIFAISGLHIAMMATVLLGMLRLFSVPREYCGLVAIPLVWLYTGATGWQASAVRSAIMATVIIFGWAIRRPSNLTNSLFAAGLIILLWDPQQLFQASFQLSFFVVLSMALLLPLVDAQVVERLNPDPLMPHDSLPLRKRIWFGLIRYVAGSFCVSVSAWIGSVPLIGLYFHMITPVSLLANLLIVPLSGLCLACGMGSLLTGWLPLVPELFNHSAWLFMRWMVGLSEWFAAWPGAYFHVATPGPWILLLFYTLLIGIGFIPKKHLIVRRWTAVALAVVTIGWLCGPSSLPALSILPVEDGVAILSHGPGRRDHYLVDTGRAIPAQRSLVPFLRASGASPLNALLLSHGDVRQIEGAATIRTNMGVKTIGASAVAFRSPAYRELRQQCQAIPGLWQTLRPGDRIGPWQVLYPPPSFAAAQADDSALVLRGDFPGLRVLLLSHLGRAGQNRLMQQVTIPELRADVVVAGLPAEGEPLASPLLRAIGPKLVIVTDARFPASQRASRNLELRLLHERATTLYLRHCGWIKVDCRPECWIAAAADGTRLQSGPLAYLPEATYIAPEEER